MMSAHMTKKALVTGANKGIGKQVAAALGRAGWTVLCGARDPGRGEAAVRELRDAGIDAVFLKVDLLDMDTLRAAAGEIGSHHRDLRLLVNNAGIPGDMGKPGYEFSVEELRTVMETNFFGPFELTRLLLPVLEANGGRIVNVTIPTQLSEFFNPFAYKVSKAAFGTMTQSLGVDFRKHGKPVEIFAVMPGATTTDLNGNSTGRGFKTAAQAGQLIADIILDGREHNCEIIDGGMWARQTP
ncbi:MAG: SDR family NAD(P)-dependent oxidoreductase [Lachnospiraceae bacterium]|nr:SDR family NAD(P)-dependent oxidoreductase [Lachnospiraceae bacterium]